MADLMLHAQMRSLRGKKVRALRRDGLIPANIYGRGIESLAVQVDARHLRTILTQAGTSTVVDVHVTTGTGSDDGQSHPALIEHVSTHPATGKVLHLDLRQVDLNRSIRAAISLVLTGESPAVEREGGVLVQQLDTVEVEALPRALPPEIEVDISGLTAIDAQITVADLRLPAGVTTDADPETVIVRIVASKLEQEVAAEEAVTAAEVAAEAADEAASDAEAAGDTAASGTDNS